jgi:hypothetical protein
MAVGALDYGFANNQVFDTLRRYLSALLKSQGLMSLMAGFWRLHRIGDRPVFRKRFIKHTLNPLIISSWLCAFCLNAF